MSDCIFYEKLLRTPEELEEFRRQCRVSQDAALDQLFRLADKDSDGKLTRQEVQGMSKDLAHCIKSYLHDMYDIVFSSPNLTLSRHCHLDLRPLPPSYRIAKKLEVKELPEALATILHTFDPNTQQSMGAVLFDELDADKDGKVPLLLELHSDVQMFSTGPRCILYFCHIRLTSKSLYPSGNKRLTPSQKKLCTP